MGQLQGRGSRVCAKGLSQAVTPHPWEEWGACCWGWGSGSVSEPALLQALGLIITVVAGFPPNFTPTRFLVPEGAIWGSGVTKGSVHTDL